MKLLLNRKYKNCTLNGRTYCIGKMYVDGVYVCDTIEDKDWGWDANTPTADIKAIKAKNKSLTAIPRGTYKVTISVTSYKFRQYAYYKNFCNGKLPRLLDVPGFEGILVHCLTPDMEILTEGGWKDYDSFKNEPEQRCYSYNTETGEVELTDIEEVIEQDYNGDLYTCDGRVSYSVTDKHKMWVSVKKHGGEREWQWRDADNIPQGSKFITATHKGGGCDITSQQKLLYRLIIATQADGYILNWSKTASQVRFHFRKERKISRMKELLEEIGDDYKMFIDNDGCTHITLSNSLSEYITEAMNPSRDIYKTKELPKELLSLKEEDMRDLVLDYLFWDGRWENYAKNKNNAIISSTNKRTIDILQMMAFLSGFRTTIYVDKRSGNRNNVYELKLYDGQELTMPESSTMKTEHYEGRVWCVRNKNHTILVRQRGHVCVIGNCGSSERSSAGCVIVGYNTIKGQVTRSQEAFEKLYRLMALAHAHGETITITIQ